MPRESDIKHETKNFWVFREAKNVFTVYRLGNSVSYSDSSYENLSLAIARCDYLQKRKDTAH